MLESAGAEKSFLETAPSTTTTTTTEKAAPANAQAANAEGQGQKNAAKQHLTHEQKKAAKAHAKAKAAKKAIKAHKAKVAKLRAKMMGGKGKDKKAKHRLERQARLAKKAKHLERKAAKKAAKIARKAAKKLAKGKAAQKKAQHKEDKARRAASHAKHKLAQAKKAAALEATREQRELEAAYRQAKDAGTLDKAAFELYDQYDAMLTNAVRSDMAVGRALDHQAMMKDHHKKYQGLLKRFRKYQAFMKQRKQEMKAVKHYQGKLQIGNHMTGGPMTSPNTAGLSKLEKYQLKVLEGENKRSDKPNVFRQKLAEKVRRLYREANPQPDGILVALLAQYGVPGVNGQEATARWTMAKNTLKQKKQIEAEQIAMGKARKAAKKAAKKAREAAALALVQSGGAPNIPAEKPRPDDWLDKYPAQPGGIKGKGDNWWGCYDCVNPRPMANAAAAAAASAAANARAAAKASGDAFLMKGLVVPPIKFDESIRNGKVLAEVMKSYGRKKTNPKTLREEATKLHRQLKGQIVDSMLSQKEHDEILLAKTEALESAIAARTGRPLMVKREAKIPAYKPPSKIPFPAYKKGDPEKDPNEMDREVTVAEAEGYLDKLGRRDRASLDNADETFYAARTEHEAFNKRYQILPKKVVWKLFEGQGDAAQLRAEEVNEYRKKHYNHPMPDGNEPW